MLKAKARKPWQDGVICDDCGREWHEVHTVNWDGPDGRGFVTLRGALGDLVVPRTLCPQCVEDLIDVLASSVDRESVVRSNRAYARERAEEILHGLMPLAEPDDRINLWERRRQAAERRGL
jgi:hypothetical protein